MDKLKTKCISDLEVIPRYQLFGVRHCRFLPTRLFMRFVRFSEKELLFEKHFVLCEVGADSFMLFRVTAVIKVLEGP